MLDSNIQDMADNITRFLVLSRDPVISAPGDLRPHKTSLAFALPEGPGRLFRALSVFALRNLDMCKARASVLPILFAARRARARVNALKPWPLLPPGVGC